MAEQLPIWQDLGVEPPALLKTNGWQPGMKPSAQHMNWLFNRIYKCLEEIQADGGTEELEALQQELVMHMADNTGHVYYADDTGTANTKVVALNPAPEVYKKGFGISFTNLVQNTGAVTINVNGLGAKPILKSNGNSLTSGSLKVGSIYTLRYNGTAFILQGEGGEYGTAADKDVIAGITFGTDEGLKTGTIVDHPAYQEASSFAGVNGTLYVRHPLGAYRTPSNGGKAEIVVTDPDFIAANFLADKNIFGLQGSIRNFGRQALGEGYTGPRSYRADSQGSLVIEPVTGYYEEGLNSGGYGSIIIGDGDFIPSNIRAGTEVLGVVGTLDAVSLGAKRMAKGTGTTGTTGSFLLSVRGLSFTPSTVIVTPIQNGSAHYQGLTVYTALSNLSSTHLGGVRINTSGSPFMLTVWTMLAGGFDISTNVSGMAVSWVAYE